MTIEEIAGEVYVLPMGSINRAHGLKLFGLFDGRDLVGVLSRRLGNPDLGQSADLPIEPNF